MKVIKGNAPVLIVQTVPEKPVNVWFFMRLRHAGYTYKQAHMVAAALSMSGLPKERETRQTTLTPAYGIGALVPQDYAEAAIAAAKRGVRAVVIMEIIRQTGADDPMYHAPAFAKRLAEQKPNGGA